MFLDLIWCFLKYYDTLNERFRAQLSRDKKLKRDTRDSAHLKPNPQPAQPLANAQQQQPTSYVNQPSAPNYIRIPAAVGQNKAQQSSNRYLEPSTAATNSPSYLEPQMNPASRPQQQDSSYLEPSNEPLLSRQGDSYGGPNYENTSYVRPVNETKRMAPKAPRTTTQMDTYGGSAGAKPIEYIDKSTDEADTYLLPRLQDTAQGTVISTYGAAPVRNPNSIVSRADFPRTSPSYYYNQKYKSVSVAPPPAPPPTSAYPIRDNSASSIRNANATETDV